MKVLCWSAFSNLWSLCWLCFSAPVLWRSLLTPKVFYAFMTGSILSHRLYKTMPLKVLEVEMSDTYKPTGLWKYNCNQVYCWLWHDLRLWPLLSTVLSTVKRKSETLSPLKGLRQVSLQPSSASGIIWIVQWIANWRKNSNIEQKTIFEIFLKDAD